MSEEALCMVIIINVVSLQHNLAIATLTHNLQIKSKTNYIKNKVITRTWEFLNNKYTKFMGEKIEKEVQVIFTLFIALDQIPSQINKNKR